MGAINYGSSNIVSLGVNVSNYNSEEDFGLMEDFYDTIKSIIDKYSLSHIDVTIEDGYYEGFYINIENENIISYQTKDKKYIDYIDNSEEKQEILKELTQLKKMLFELAENGLVEYSAGWCTGYSNFEDTIKSIKKAIKTEKDTVKNLPTWYKLQLSLN